MDGTFSHSERPNSLTDAIGGAARPPGGVDPGIDADASLLAACRRGEAAAYGELVRRYQDRVFNLCFRMCGSREDAEDHTQEAFVRAMQSLDRFAERSRFYTWVFRIAVNLVISDRRKSGRRTMYSLESRPDESEDGHGRDSRRANVKSGVSQPHDQMVAAEQREAVSSALMKIDEEHRTVLVLRDMEGLNYEEIADVLDIPTGTVKSRIHRARQAIRDLLAPLIQAE
ncbi:MAG: sigma-70 family RNA polymerase sigma factor [Phycisphaerae bacterium]|nr:sigma-70 family RNA polymerase sigma factor [Phycisphaerae bacterium]